jgi:hypothetical protein
VYVDLGLASNSPAVLTVVTSSISMARNGSLETFHTLQRHYTENSKHIFPEKELLGLSPNSYIHVSMCNLNIPTTGLPILLQENRWTDPGNI